MQIEIFSDVACPWGYIVLGRLERAIYDLALDGDVTVEFRSFQLNPHLPSKGRPLSEHFLEKFGVGMDIDAMGRQIESTARAEGLPFRLDSIANVPNTFDAHRLVKLSAPCGAQSEVLVRLAQAYFHDGADIGSLDVLLEIGRAADLSGEALNEFERRCGGSAEVVADRALAQSLGIASAPTVVVDRVLRLEGTRSRRAMIELLERAAKLPAHRLAASYGMAAAGGP